MSEKVYKFITGVEVDRDGVHVVIAQRRNDDLTKIKLSTHEAGELIDMLPALWRIANEKCKYYSREDWQ